MPDPARSKPMLKSHSPAFRNIVHFAVFFLIGLPLLAFVRLNAEYAWLAEIDYWLVGFFALATLFNVLLLRFVPVLNRVVRGNEGWYNGLWIYPCSLMVCFALFPHYAAFGAWAAMACGDAPASFFGRMFSSYRLPWNAKKSVAGSIAFAAFALGALILTLYFMPCPLFLKKSGAPEWPYVWTLAVLAALAGALAESFDTGLDDNVRVPFSAATTLVAAAQFLKFSTRNLAETTHVQPQHLLHALLANSILGVIVLLCRFADFPATFLGMMLGVLIYFYANWQGYLLFGLFVALGSFLSKMGLQRKTENHTAEANHGKRGIANVAANLLVPALCCAAYPILAGRPSLLMAFAGSIAAALADTASSEIGVLSPHEPWLITTFKRVAHGTNGAVSLLGFVGAIAGSGIIAVAAYGSGFFRVAAGPAATFTPWILTGATAAIFFSGIAGTLVDSYLGATIEDKFKFVGKGAVNFACTLTGAMVAGLLTEVWMWV